MYRETGLVNSPPPSGQDDSVLLGLVQRGDEYAMAALFDRYSKVVYSVALRVLRDPASAEDVLQEIFMQIWRNPGSFVATRGSLGGWLAVVSRNRSIDTLRRRRPTEPRRHSLRQLPRAQDARTRRGLGCLASSTVHKA